MGCDYVKDRGEAQKRSVPGRLPPPAPLHPPFPGVQCCQGSVLSLGVSLLCLAPSGGHPSCYRGAYQAQGGGEGDRRPLED